MEMFKFFHDPGSPAEQIRKKNMEVTMRRTSMQCVIVIWKMLFFKGICITKKLDVRTLKTAVMMLQIQLCMSGINYILK